MLLQWVVEIASNPPPRVAWYDPRGELIPEGEDKARGRVVHTALSIKNTRSMLQVSSHWLARGHVTALLISDWLRAAADRAEAPRRGPVQRQGRERLPRQVGELHAGGDRPARRHPRRHGAGGRGTVSGHYNIIHSFIFPVQIFLKI